MKLLVAYYSKSGNNEYLARRISDALGCDYERISPRFEGMFFQLVFSAFKKGWGIRRFSHDVSDYDRVVLCGPIWMGQVVYPLRAFIKKHGPKIRSLCFATCCGGGDAEKDDQFGYSSVFASLEGLVPGRLAVADAFSVGLVLPEGAKDSDAVMKTRLSDANFVGPIAERFERFVARVKA